jgi:hypothetical protein
MKIICCLITIWNTLVCFAVFAFLEQGYFIFLKVLVKITIFLIITTFG